MSAPVSSPTSALDPVGEFFDHIDLLLMAGMVTEAREYLADLRRCLEAAQQESRDSTAIEGVDQ